MKMREWDERVRQLNRDQYWYHPTHKDKVKRKKARERNLRRAMEPKK